MSGVLCIVYVSSAKTSILHRLGEVAGHRLVHSFKDAVYNRTSFYLLQPFPAAVEDSIAEDAWRLCNEAITQIDFSVHSGSHPTLGTVDHICFSPLGTTTLQEACVFADKFAIRLNQVNKIPIYLYGGLSATQRKLAELRKSESN